MFQRFNIGDFMKKISGILLMIVILLICARTVEAGEMQVKPLLDEVSSENLKNTKFTPVLGAAINTNENLIYCSTFQMAWNQLCDKYANGTLEIENAPDYVEKLNALYKQAPLISDNSILSIAGTGKKEILSKINRAVDKKFRRLNKSEQPPKFNFTLSSNEIVILSYLYKNIKFGTPFERISPLGMGSEGMYEGQWTPVETFGFDRNGFDNSKNKRDYSNQFSVLYYKDIKKGRRPSEAIIKLTDKSMSDEIIISSRTPGSTLEESYNDIINTINLNVNNEKPVIGSIRIPKLNFNIIHNYNSLLNNMIHTFKIKKAIQKTVFRINDNGDFNTTALQHCGIEIQILCPFIIYLKDKSKDKPYFVAYVTNSEILEKNTYDCYGEYDEDIKQCYYLEQECGYYGIYYTGLNEFHEPKEHKYKAKDGTNVLLLALKKKAHIISRLTAIYTEQSYKVENEPLSIFVKKAYNMLIEKISMHVNVNDGDDLGITPLIYAVEACDYEMVELLLKLGADPSRKRKDGKDALTIAKEKKNEKIIELLLKPPRDRVKLNRKKKFVN